MRQDQDNCHLFVNHLCRGTKDHGKTRENQFEYNLGAMVVVVSPEQPETKNTNWRFQPDVELVL